MNYTIWESTLDKKFTVWVERVAPYEGELVISEKGKMLTIKQVTISHDAMFGPDINDIRDWEAFCIDFIDNKYQK
jgi:hypothetical protein